MLKKPRLKEASPPTNDCVQFRSRDALFTKFVDGCLLSSIMDKLGFKENASNTFSPNPENFRFGDLLPFAMGGQNGGVVCSSKNIL